MMELDDVGVRLLRVICVVLGFLGGRVIVSCGMLVWVMNGVDRGRGGIGGICVVIFGNIKLKVIFYNKLEFIFI